MGERVAVDDQERRAHAVPARAASSRRTARAPRSPRAAARSRRCAASACGEPGEIGGLDRRAVGDPQRPEAREPVGAGDAGGHERHARLERDPRGAGVPARLVPLAQPLRAPRPLREHDDDVARAAELRRPCRSPAGRASRGRPGSRRPRSTIQPSGGQKSSFFAMKRRKRRGNSGIPSGHGSKFDQWFAASTQPPVRDVLAARRQRRRYTVRQHGPAERRDEEIEPARPRRSASIRRAGYVRPAAKRRHERSLRCHAMTSLVIVESPAKARTIAGYLGQRLRRGVEHRPHPRPAEPRLRRAEGGARSATASSASTSSTTSSRTTSSTPTRSRSSPISSTS